MRKPKKLTVIAASGSAATIHAYSTGLEKILEKISIRELR
jgi:hypothetical protein